MAHSPARVLACIALLAGCESRSYGAPPPPPPAPAAPAPGQGAPAPDLTLTEPLAPSPAPSGKRDVKSKREPSAASRGGPPPAPAKAAPAARATPAAQTAAPVPPPPAEKTPAAARSAGTAVRVPESTHVRIELPAGLQADLDRDPRMQPWVNKAVSAIERCYAPLRAAGAAGVIEVRLVMHENERPSAEPVKLPGALTPMVTCVSGDLLRIKMPLFTGKEGTRYTLKIHLAR